MSRSSLHCLSLCPVFQERCVGIAAKLGVSSCGLTRSIEIGLAILRARPEQAGYADAVGLMYDLDVAESAFWCAQ